VFTRLGQYESARRTLKKTTHYIDYHHYKTNVKCYRALSYAVEKEYQKALEKIPSYKKIKSQNSLQIYWVEILWLCASQDISMVDQKKLDACMEFLLSAEERGTYRKALLMGAMVARLFHAAGDQNTAEQALDVMRRVKDELQADHGAAQLIDDVAAEP